MSIAMMAIGTSTPARNGDRRGARPSRSGSTGPRGFGAAIGSAAGPGASSRDFSSSHPKAIRVGGAGFTFVGFVDIIVDSFGRVASCAGSGSSTTTAPVCPRSSRRDWGAASR